jgi:hypothetical protein
MSSYLNLTKLIDYVEDGSYFTLDNSSIDKKNNIKLLEPVIMNLMNYVEEKGGVCLFLENLQVNKIIERIVAESKNYQNKADLILEVLIELILISYL